MHKNAHIYYQVYHHYCHGVYAHMYIYDAEMDDTKIKTETAIYNEIHAPLLGPGGYQNFQELY